MTKSEDSRRKEQVQNVRQPEARCPVQSSSFLTHSQGSSGPAWTTPGCAESQGHCELPQQSTTNWGLNRNVSLVLQFWRLEARDRGVVGAPLPERRVLPASSSVWWWYAATATLDVP